MPNVVGEQSTSSLGANPHLVLSTGSINVLQYNEKRYLIVLQYNVFGAINWQHQCLGFLFAL